MCGAMGTGRAVPVPTWVCHVLWTLVSKKKAPSQAHTEEAPKHHRHTESGLAQGGAPDMEPQSSSDSATSLKALVVLLVLLQLWAGHAPCTTSHGASNIKDMSSAPRLTGQHLHCHTYSHLPEGLSLAEALRGSWKALEPTVQETALILDTTSGGPGVPCLL